ncbi:MAG: hypothetical protein J6A79_07865 [Clostridia bacterium]|nr:hypothetical protein [Clostridia bacterium]
MAWYNSSVGRQVCRWASLHDSYNMKGGGHMSEYEIIMIILTVLLVVFTAIGSIR